MTGTDRAAQRNSGKVSRSRSSLRLLGLVVTLWAGSGWAAALDPSLLDARSLAMGGALRSLAETQAAARMNPAALSLRRGFFGGAAYATGRSRPLDATQLTLVDSITSPMGGAIQYLRLKAEDEREDVGLSLSAGGRGLYWGATGRFVHARERGSSDWDDTFSGDVGFLFDRPGGVRIGVVGYDLLDAGSLFLERRLALGVSRSGSGGLTGAFDLVRTLRRDFADGLDLHLGVEYVPVGSAWALRAGQRWDSQSGKDFASVGVGWARGTLQLGYGVRLSRQDPGKPVHAFSVEAAL
jgi:hypothetical protein